MAGGQKHLWRRRPDAGGEAQGPAAGELYPLWNSNAAPLPAHAVGTVPGEHQQSHHADAAAAAASPGSQAMQQQYGAPGMSGNGGSGAHSGCGDGSNSGSNVTPSSDSFRLGNRASRRASGSRCRRQASAAQRRDKRATCLRPSRGKAPPGGHRQLAAGGGQPRRPRQRSSGGCRCA